VGERQTVSQKFEDVLDASNTPSDVWADSAYRSAEIEEKLAECGLGRTLSPSAPAPPCQESGKEAG
jgi:hypothetical protein